MVICVLLALAPAVTGYGMFATHVPTLWALVAQCCVNQATAAGSDFAAAMSSPDGYGDAAKAAGAAAATAIIERGARALARR